MRKTVQALAALLQNGYLAFPWTGNIYRGKLKYACTPGLNCHSCPAALFACPLGTLQHFMAGAKSAVKWANYQLGFYILGFLMMVGVTGGRFACGWLCPFGFLQELLHRIPSPKFLLPHWSRHLRIPILAVFVLVLPVALAKTFIPGDPWFCKTICPAGTLEGSALYFIMPGLSEQIGPLLYLKIAILALVLIFAVFTFRPYCKALCPLGLIYGFFNRVSLIGIAFDKTLCGDCGDCKKKCQSSLDPRTADGSPACIRCMDCVGRACPRGALTLRVGGAKESGGAADPIHTKT